MVPSFNRRLNEGHLALALFRSSSPYCNRFRLQSLLQANDSPGCLLHVSLCVQVVKTLRFV